MTAEGEEGAKGVWWVIGVEVDLVGEGRVRGVCSEGFEAAVFDLQFGMRGRWWLRAWA